MATKTQSLTVPAPDKTGQGCHCGCAPCDGTCCRLDCIVKPHFGGGTLSSLFSTHPPLEKRIQALREMTVTPQR